MFLALFGFLLYSAAPGLYWGDSAEYTTLGCTLGVGHSPGHPLMALAGRLAAGLPLEPFPFRVHHVSILFSALAVPVLFFFLLRLTGGMFPAAAGAALFACGRAFLSHSLFAEVYGLHLFLFSAALLCLAHFEKEKRRPSLCLALGLVFAGLAHHYLMLFAYIGAAVYLLLIPGRAHRTAGATLLLLFAMYVLVMFRSYDVMENVRLILKLGIIGGWALLGFYLVFLGFDMEKGLRPTLRTALPILFLMAAGLFLFSYLPLASARGPGADWWDPETFPRFTSLLLLKGYTATLPDDFVNLISRLRLKEIIQQVPLPFLIAAIPGIIVLAFRNARLLAALLVILLANSAGALMIEHGKPDALRIPLYLIASSFFAAGLAWILSLLQSLLRFASAPRRRVLSLLAYAVYTVIATGVTAVLITMAVRLGGLPMNADDNAYRLGRGIASSVEDRSILFIGVQTPSIMDYFEHCEDRFLRGKRAAILPVSFLSFSWKLEQLERRYPWLDFPPFAPDEDERDLFKLRSEPRLRYATELVSKNGPFLDAVYTDFLFIPPETNLASTPYGYLYRLVPASRLRSTGDFALGDSRPSWSPAAAMSPLTRENVGSILNERGNLYMQYGIAAGNEAFVATAIDEFDRAILIKEDYPEPYANKGAAVHFLGDYKGAVELQETAVRLAPDRAEFHDQLATTHYRRRTRRSIQKAIAFWTAAKMLDPDNPRYHHNIGTVLVGIQNLPAAMNSYQRAIELDPKYTEAYVNLARVCQAMENCSGAVSNAEAARNLAPDRPEVRAELIGIYYHCRMKRLFELEIEEFIESFPHDLTFYHNLGVIYRNIGQPEAAVRAYREALKLNPDYKLMEMFGSLDGCDEAIPTIEEAAKLVPEDPGIQMLLAQRYFHCGRVDDAGRTLAEAKKKFPRHSGVLTLLKQLEEQEESSE